MGDDPRGLAVGPDLWVVPELLIRFVRAVHELNRCEPRHGTGLTAQQIRALLYLIGHDGASIKELAQALSVSEARASRLADELGDEGHLIAERDAADRRQVRLHVAPLAAESARRIYSERKMALQAALADASERDVQTFTRLLGRIVEQYEALADQAAAVAPVDATVPANPA